MGFISKFSITKFSTKIVLQVILLSLLSIRIADASADVIEGIISDDKTSHAKVYETFEDINDGNFIDTPISEIKTGVTNITLSVGRISGGSMIYKDSKPDNHGNDSKTDLKKGNSDYPYGIIDGILGLEPVFRLSVTQALNNRIHLGGILSYLSLGHKWKSDKFCPYNVYSVYIGPYLQVFLFNNEILSIYISASVGYSFLNVTKTSDVDSIKMDLKMKNFNYKSGKLNSKLGLVNGLLDDLENTAFISQDELFDAKRAFFNDEKEYNSFAFLGGLGMRFKYGSFSLNLDIMLDKIPRLKSINLIRAYNADFYKNILKEHLSGINGSSYRLYLSDYVISIGIGASVLI